MKVKGAAISLQGVNFAIVLVGQDLIASPGEADMAIESLRPAFGDVPVVLMAQKEDGSPRYYGDEDLVRSLAGILVDDLPWKEYSA